MTVSKRAARIELASSAWKAEVLPLNYARSGFLIISHSTQDSTVFFDLVTIRYFSPFFLNRLYASQLNSLTGALCFANAPLKT